MLQSRFYRKYLLPGFVFQSIVIGGGYGTGREIVEFFLNDGPISGYLGMLVSTVIWSVVLAIGFELARREQVYDYRAFIRRLLGPAWIGFEVVYVIGMVLVVSVLGSASGELAAEVFDISPIYGIVVMIALVGVLVYFGTSAIERVFSIWSFALYGVFLLVIVAAFFVLGDSITGSLGQTEPDANWMLSGSRYAAYNVGLMPAMLFALRHLETRREAMIAGSVAGVVAMLPGVVLFTALLGRYPEILTAAIPADFLLAGMNIPVLRVAFQIILFGTLIETGIGLIHGFNERIAGVYAERGEAMPRSMRFGIGLTILVSAVFIADAVGIVGLIRSGYGALTWGYWIVFVIPVLTIGLWRIVTVRKS